MAKKKAGSRPEPEPSRAGAVPDPLQLWREWVDRTERQWNATLNELTTSEGFGQAQSKLFEGLLAVQSQMNSATERYFALINLPSRTDVLSLGQQLASLEERLVELERLVRELPEGTPTRTSPEPPPRPPLRRTRKAPTDSALAPARPADAEVDDTASGADRKKKKGKGTGKGKGKKGRGKEKERS